MQQARVITNLQEQVNSQATHVEEHKHTADGQPTLIINSAKRLFNHDDRAQFYTGQDRISLQLKQIQRVREMQEENDNLQRQINENERELLNSQDPLTILAEIEHCNIMIARNTGEILTIYTQNENRLRRIADLDAQNIKLQQDMTDMQGKFITCHDMHQRTKFASEFFMSKAIYEKNISEIRELSQM